MPSRLESFHDNSNSVNFVQQNQLSSVCVAKIEIELSPKKPKKRCAAWGDLIHGLENFPKTTGRKSFVANLHRLIRFITNRIAIALPNRTPYVT